MDTVDTFSKISDNIEAGAFSQCLCLWTKAAMRRYGVVYETWDVSRGLSETTRFSRALSVVAAILVAYVALIIVGSP
jgi:hypothetical protein